MRVTVPSGAADHVRAVGIRRGWIRPPVLRRGYARPLAPDQELTAKYMLMELDYPVGEDDRREILGKFGDTLEPLRQMLLGLETRDDVDIHQRFGMVHLLTRSLSDLLAGGHLASHFYLPQANSLLRTIIDSCDLIDLFADDPAQAEKWVTTDQPHIDFSPARVRTLLGQARYNAVHGYLSEAGSHPRFLGARLSGAFTVDPEDPDQQIATFRIGPMWPEHPATLTIWHFAFWLAVCAANRAGHLVSLTEDPHAAEHMWLRLFLDCIDASEAGVALVNAILGPPPDLDTKDLYADVRAQVLSHLSTFEQ
jgi:hypothetical protein